MKHLKALLFFVVATIFIHAHITAQVKKTTTTKKSVAKKSTAKAPVKKVKTKIATPVKPASPAGTRIKITTDSGVIVLRLYDKTPLHRDNFIKLVKDKFYDSLIFHRVIRNFMIQGGDPESKNAQQGQMLGNGGPGYEIPAEFDTTLFHKKGVLAAARNGDNVNPERKSSGSQFYIVQGKTFTDQQLDQLEVGRLGGRKIPLSQREVYKTVGGTPHLDMNYTVFGETESGLEVIDKIAASATDSNNRPLKDIRMKIELVTDK